MTDAVQRLTAALSDRYRIERELGQGGMATVYLAHDIKHDRDVAIKVLHPDLGAALGGDRFLSEIRTTARLQHPHILPLLDSGDANGLLYYVMPVVTGETLRARLDREQQLPVGDAVLIAREVADALGYAHGLGVIHRDIKPENILLQGGHALVADFGIALAVQSAGGERMTQTGLSLGTPQYMSPEQAMGEKQIDARSDVYALAAVTYEMLAGDAPFTGGSVQAIVAKIMTERPTPLHRLRDTVPAHVEEAVVAGLAKLPADRPATAAEFAAALAVPGAPRGFAPHGAAPGPLGMSRRTTGLVMAGLAGVALAGIALGLWHRRSPATERISRFALAMPSAQQLLSPGGLRFAWSPDGASFVYPGPGAGRSQLWERRLDALEATPIPGSDGATSPAYSPDGNEIAFVTLSPFMVKVIARSGGQPRTVLGVGASGGGVGWSDDGYLYVDLGNGLGRIRPDGSGKEMLVPFDTLHGEAGVAWPMPLPGARGVLMRIRRGGEAMADYRIVLFDLKHKIRKDLVTGIFARYSDTGHLLWVTSDGALHAQPFDLDDLQLRGTPVTLWNGLSVAAFGATDLALSRAGDLIYVPGVVRSAFAEFAWVARDGTKTPAKTKPLDGLVATMALAPDGRSVALEILRSADASNLSRIWVTSLDGGPTQLVTTGNSSSYNPVWAPSGQELYYVSDDANTIYRRRADGSGTAQRIAHVESVGSSLALHPDGRTMVIRGEAVGQQRRELMRLRLGTDTIPTPLLTTANGESSATFSPDGKWIAYVSRESGQAEVYVRPFPDANASRVQVSVDGGAAPKWNPAGHELFYISAAGDMMAAQMAAGPAFSVRSVDRLFTPLGFQGGNGALLYEPSTDGKRFLMLDITAAPQDARGDRLVVVQNFATELRKRVPR